MVQRIDITAVHATAELERIGWEWSSVGDNEIRCSCPVPSHKDDTPSVNFNVGKNIWQCHAAGCKAKGDIVSFLAYALEIERGVIIEDLKTRYTLEKVKSINPDVIERYHDGLSKAGPLLVELKKRGVTEEDCRKARIGFWKGRLTIPIYDISRNVINCRRYLPGAPGDKKMQNTPGYGKAAIYQIEQLEKFDKVLFCGGELKALVAGRLLNPHGIGCFSVSAGEGTWQAEWNEKLKDKTVYVCMDIDQAGQVAAQEIGLRIRVSAQETYIVTVPLDPVKYPKGDINDLIGLEGGTDEDLLRAIELAELFVLPETKSRSIGKDATSVQLAHTLSPQNAYRRLQFQGVIFAVIDTPFILPREVKVYCDRSQSNCALCPILAHPPEGDKGVTQDIPPFHEGLLDMIESPTRMRDPVLKKILGIPPCKSANVETSKQYAAKDIRITPEVSVTSLAADNNVRIPAYVIDRDIEANMLYEMQGVTYAHPKTGQAVLLIDKAHPVEDSISKFTPEEGDVAKLRGTFSPNEWTVDSLEEKLREIYDDLAYNVHGIYGRFDMQMVMDLTWHSPLFISYDGRRLKGWVNSCIVGDSGQGKTEMSVELLNHYGLGSRVECKNASAAGLIGGLQQINKRWFVSWGVIPQADRRLVILEEAKGLFTEEIGKMTDMRSSGIAEIPKIEHSRANARTRLMFISNPRDEKQIASFTFGVQAFARLIGAQEDIRRFDVAMAVASSQVDIDEINKRRIDRESVDPISTSELSRKLLLLTWTRNVEDVLFAEDALEEIQAVGSDLTRAYAESIPLLDSGTTREKLTRLAAALAARTASFNNECQLIVRRCHVQFVVQFLNRIYSDPVFGFKAFSDAQRSVSEIGDEAMVRDFLFTMKYPLDTISGLLTHAADINHEDIMNLFSLDRETASEVQSFLVRKNCLRRGQRRAYVRTEAFIQLLKRILPDAPSKSEVVEEF